MAALNLFDRDSELGKILNGGQPQTAAQAMTDATLNEMDKQNQPIEAAKAAAEQAVIEQQKQQNLLDQARAAYKAAYQADAPLITDKTGLALINGILQNKTAWQDFNDKAYTANVEGRQNDYNALLQEREKAAQRGAYLREQADKLGYNLKNFGSDVTLDQARANLALNNTRALDRELKEGLDAGSVYASKFNEYKKNGITDEYADRYAREEANKYLNDRTNKLVDTLVNQGFDERGALSRQGIQLLSRLLSENPEQVQLWLGTNASPMMEWGRQSEWDKAEQAFGHNMNILNRQAEIAADQAERNLRNQITLHSLFGGGGRSASGGGRGGSGRSSGGGKRNSEGTKSKKISLAEAKEVNAVGRYISSLDDVISRIEQKNAYGQNTDEDFEEAWGLIGEANTLLDGDEDHKGIRQGGYMDGEDYLQAKSDIYKRYEYLKDFAENSRTREAKKDEIRRRAHRE